MPRCSSPRRSSTGDPGRPFRRFVIFGIGRCGSSLLVDMLNSQPSVSCDFLVTGPASDPYAGMRAQAAQAASLGLSAYGVRLLVPHLVTADSEADVPGLIRRAWADGWTVIHTKRSSLLRSAISYVYAAQHGFHLRQDDGPWRFEPMTIDIEELFRWLALVIEWAEIERRALDGISCIEISYEDDLASETAQRETMMLLTSELLGVQAVPARTGFRRQLPAGGLPDLILNHAEIMRFLEEKKLADLADS